MITNIGGCSKYTIKYIGKIDVQNCVIMYTDNHKNGKLVTRGNFLHNTKFSALKKMKNKFLKRKNVVRLQMISDVLYL